MKLEKEGWEKRNIVDAFKADEQKQMYEELGYEVLVEDLNVKEMTNDECNTCFLENPEAFKIIFTRNRSDEMSELF